MSRWSATKARLVLAAIERLGWTTKHQKGSHRKMLHPKWGEATWAFHDADEIGPKMLARIAKTFKFTPDDV